MMARTEPFYGDLFHPAGYPRAPAVSATIQKHSGAGTFVNARPTNPCHTPVPLRFELCSLALLIDSRFRFQPLALCPARPQPNFTSCFAIWFAGRPDRRARRVPPR